MTSVINQVPLKPVDPLDKTFNDGTGITGCTIYTPHSKDKLNSANYFVSLSQAKANEAEQTTIIYPLYHLDEFNVPLETIAQGLFQELFNGRKFKGIGQKLLTKYQDKKYFIEFKGGYDNPTKFIQKTGRKAKVIEVKNVTGFSRMLEKVDRHADKYLENLAQEEGRDIAKEREVLNNKQIEHKLKRTNSAAASGVVKKQKLEENVNKAKVSTDKLANKVGQASKDKEEGIKDEQEDWSWYIPHQLNIKHNFHVMK